MRLINKHPNYEQQLLSVSDNDGSRFELLSLKIDWVLQKIPKLHDDVLSELEVSNGIYIITMVKSFDCDAELKVMFGYNKSTETLTLYSVRKIE
ncbi:MAG: hypothetical protein ACYDCN_08830 [Bacteroidia bacterium]